MPTSKYNRRKAAQKIREWQKESRLKGYEIAKMARISAPYYCDISRGKQRGSVEVLSRISAVFGKTVNDLFELPTQSEAAKLQEELSKSLRQAVGPILNRKETSDLVQFYRLWSEKPEALGKALKVFHNAGVA